MKYILIILIGAGIGYGAVFALNRKSAVPPPQAQESQPQSLVVTTNVVSRVRPWAEVQGGDFQEYARNLRSLGCPEETAGDLVFYAMMRQADARLSPELQLNTTALTARRREAMAELKSMGYARPGPPDYYLDSAQVDLVQDCLKQFPLKADDAATTERHATLPGFNPVQHIYVRSEFERFGITIDSALAGFRPTKSEYCAIVQLMLTNSMSCATNAIHQTLPEDRFKEYSGNSLGLRSGVYGMCVNFPFLRSKRTQMLSLLNNTNISEPEFRNRAMDLVGRECFEEYIALRNRQTGH